MKNDVMRQLLSFVTGAVVATKCACKVKLDVSRGSATGHINPHFTCKVKRKQGTPSQHVQLLSKIEFLLFLLLLLLFLPFDYLNSKIPARPDIVWISGLSKSKPWPAFFTWQFVPTARDGNVHGGGCMMSLPVWYHVPCGGSLSRGETLPRNWHLVVATALVGTHPTGMHLLTCLDDSFLTVNCMLYREIVISLQNKIRYMET